MRRTLILPLILLAVFGMTAGDCDCGGMTKINPPASLDQIAVSSSAEMAMFCCDPENLPNAVGTITITNNTDTEEPIYFNFENSDVIAADPASGTVAEGETVTIAISVVACDFESASVDMNYGFDSTAYPFADFPELHGTQTVTVNNACHDLRQLIELVCPGDVVVASLLALAMIFDPVGFEVLHSAVTLAAVIPFLPYTEIHNHGAFLKHFTALAIQRIWGGREDFPCGPGVNGYTVCPNIPLQPTEGDYFLVWTSTEGVIPVADNEHTYQFGFVFDADGNTSNNYQGSGDFENDFYDDTDRWYSVEYTPAGGWQLKVTDARNGFGFQQVASAARVIIHESVMLLAVPTSEFADPTPRYRVTAFAHHGDYGMNDPFYWSGDLHPTVAEGLDELTAGTE